MRAGALTLLCVVAAASRLDAQLQQPLFDVTTYPLPGLTWLTDVDVADVNGDGIPDIGILAEPLTYRVLLGRGDGSFFPPLVSTVGATQIWQSSLADVSGDGKADRLLVGIHLNVYVQLSQGDGQFTTSGIYPIGCAPWEALAADLDGDLLPDMVTSFGDHLICDVGFTTYLGDGHGHFQYKYTGDPSFVIADMNALALADLDGDGVLDLVATTSAGSLCRFAGSGDGTFGPTVMFPSTGKTADVADLDEDGWPDVVSVLLSGVQAYLGTGQHGMAPVIVSPAPPTDFWTINGDPHLALGDFNADGHVDAASSSDDQLAISLGLGSGAFEPAAPVTTSLPILWVRAADLNADGSVDVVATSGGNVVVFLNSRPAWPWTTVAPGLPAPGVAAPKLSASGPLTVGHPVSLALIGGAGGAPAVLVVGPDRINASFKGGVLVPMPTLLLPLTLDAGGGFDLSAPLPTSLPSGAHLYLQTWIVDAAGPVGFTSSNAVVGTAP